MTAGGWVLVAAAVLAVAAAGLWRWERTARRRATIALLVLTGGREQAVLETAVLEYLYQLPARTPEHELPQE